MAAIDRSDTLMPQSVSERVRGLLQSVAAKPVPVGAEEAQEGPMTVWIYIDTSKQVGDRDHLKVFASEVVADTWLEENDPEGVAFEYDVLE